MCFDRALGFGLWILGIQVAWNERDPAQPRIALSYPSRKSGSRLDVFKLVCTRLTYFKAKGVEEGAILRVIKVAVQLLFPNNASVVLWKKKKSA
jgi:hypothetical protein